MADSPVFFVPAATPENLESVYSDFAKWCNRPVPKMENRIYSITFDHDGDELVATVGEQLRGTRTKTTRSKGKRIERAQSFSDPAVILAIFPGRPYLVVTNFRIDPKIRSGWENPFMAGDPRSVVRFASAR